MIRLLVTSCAFLSLVLGQQDNCSYYQKVSPGQTLHSSSPGYPGSYPGNIRCRWIYDCGDSNCKADCDVIDLPSSPDCTSDKLLISRSGDSTLKKAETLCGKGSTSVTSMGTQLSIGLVTGNESHGKFHCSITAVPSSPSTPCSCGYHKTTRIVGGTETAPHEFPMMVGIVDVDNNFDTSGVIRCGGTIIDTRYIVTAAHCMNNVDLNSLRVLVGGHNSAKLNPSSKLVKIDDYITHPRYNRITSDYDVALLLLSEDLNFDSNVGPVCLPLNYPASAILNGKLTALGWGTQFFGGPTSETLEKVNLDVISNNECRLRGGTPTSSQFCTYTLGKDTCQLDSGGPLLKTNNANGLLYLGGIISVGTFCGTPRPAFNTNVKSVIGWIQEMTPEVKYCEK